jgi:chromosome segregation ATPase
MNRFLEKLNLVGVIILAGLCVAQWKINRDANLDLQHAQKIQREQTTKLADQEKMIQGQVADLEVFRAQLLETKASEKELENKFTVVDRANHELTNERDQLKTSISNWDASVKARDEQLRQASTNLQKLVQSRDDAIEKYNDLAKRHNQLVGEVNAARTNTVANAKSN